MSAFSLRPAAPDDEALLLELYASTRAAEMAMVPWPDQQKAAFIHMQFQAQRAHYTQYHPNSRHEIILRDGTPVGRLWVDREADRIHILDLVILPRLRNAGTGTAVLQELLAEAAGTGQAVTIHVESFSPSVRLLRRLGFHDLGGTELHRLFEWKQEGESQHGAAVHR